MVSRKVRQIFEEESRGNPRKLIARVTLKRNQQRFFTMIKSDFTKGGDLYI